MSDAINAYYDALSVERERREKAEAELSKLRLELQGVLQSLLALANAYCANKTADYAEARLKELKGTP